MTQKKNEIDTQIITSQFQPFNMKNIQNRANVSTQKKKPSQYFVSTPKVFFLYYDKIHEVFAFVSTR